MSIFDNHDSSTIAQEWIKSNLVSITSAFGELRADLFNTGDVWFTVDIPTVKGKRIFMGGLSCMGLKMNGLPSGLFYDKDTPFINIYCHGELDLRGLPTRVTRLYIIGEVTRIYCSDNRLRHIDQLAIQSPTTPSIELPSLVHCKRLFVRGNGDFDLKTKVRNFCHILHVSYDGKVESRAEIRLCEIDKIMLTDEELKARFKKKAIYECEGVNYNIRKKFQDKYFFV